jgi:hypothetical protein
MTYGAAAKVCRVGTSAAGAIIIERPGRRNGGGRFWARAGQDVRVADVPPGSVPEGTGEMAFMTGISLATVMWRLASADSVITPAWWTPRGTIRSYQDGSQSAFSANTCVVTPLATRGPSASTLRSNDEAVIAVRLIWLLLRVGGERSLRLPAAPFGSAVLIIFRGSVDLRPM